MVTLMTLFSLVGAEAAIPKFELIQSVPVETDLAQPDLPFAKETWLELVRGARRTIDLAQFYFSAEKGEALDEVIAELARAGKRGVKIRALVSNELAEEYGDSVAQMRAIPGIELRIYDIEKLTGGILHAKYWIVDDETSFVGSQNFDWRALTQIHETGLLARDATLADSLRRVFEVDWRIAGGAAPVEAKAPKPAGKPVPGSESSLELVASPPELNPAGIRAAADALVELLGSAKKDIRVQLLSYSPVEKTRYWGKIDMALRSAAARGVDVKLLVSHWNLRMPDLDHLKSLDLLPGIEVKVATIPKASRGEIPFARVIHSKYLVVDGGSLWIGTSNWSEDYFTQSRNVEVIAKKPDLAAKAGRIFAKLWDSQYVEAVAGLQPRPR